MGEYSHSVKNTFPGGELIRQVTFGMNDGVVSIFALLAGALKKFVTGVNWLKSGVEMLIVGFFAFTVSYVIGLFIPF
ncbi:MAG: hypothetical protein JXR86_12495 [Spirochaetales bacterium]|nr:hypothetical protein [Spirochaetales bacterium]